MSPRTYANARERILDAAERVMLRDGVGATSVDAVIAEADLSKGGFFYHFKTKEQLLDALIERLVREVEAEAEALIARDHGPGRRMRAHVQLAFDLPPARRRRYGALMAAFIEGAIAHRAIVDKARAVNQAAVDDFVADGVPLGRVLAISLALDGYWLWETLGTMGLPPAARAALRATLLELARPTSDATPRPRARRRARAQEDEP